jgi:hypothetical protein
MIVRSATMLHRRASSLPRCLNGRGGKIPVLLSPFRHPSAAADAARALAPPSASAAIPAEAARVVGPLVAGPHYDAYSPASSDPSLHRGDAAAVDDHSVSDLDAIPNGRFASTATRKDQNAPVAIVDGVSEGRSGDGNPGKSHNQDWHAGAEHLIDFAEHRRTSQSFLTSEFSSPKVLTNAANKNPISIAFGTERSS